MSSLFIFGAGASYGSGRCTPSNPPLGSKLFMEMQAAGGVAASVGSDIASAFAMDFERGMEMFWEQRNTDVTAFLRDMARFFAKYEPQAGNAYLELVRMIGSKRNIVLSTTNYDLLIEHAICKNGKFVAYGGRQCPENNIPVLKIHGSCNFLPNLGGASLRGVKFNLGKNAAAIEAGIRIASSPNEIIEFCNTQDSVAPALAIYSPDKPVIFCKNFVLEQQQLWFQEITQASKIFIIGLRVHLIDEHIWMSLAKSKAELYYVGLEPEAFLKWAKESRVKSAYVMADTFQRAFPRIAAKLNLNAHRKGRS